MREIINLSIGQGGNQLGRYFWESLCQEHSIDFRGKPVQIRDYQKECIQVYFNEVGQDQYEARSIQIDGGFISQEDVISTDLRFLFNQTSFIYGQCSAGNSFEKGKYELDIEEQVQEEVRKQVESCDSFQGFQLLRSLGGGTGSGFGDYIQSYLREEYLDKMITNFCIFPSPLVSDTVVEPYNSVLSMPGIIENSDLCFVFDNSSLYHITTKTQGIIQPTYKDFNSILQKCLSGATTQWRFPCSIYNDMRKFSSNFLPFPKLNFINTGIAPLYHQMFIPNRDIGVSELIRILKNNWSFLNQANNLDEIVEFMSLSIFRGNFSEQEIQQENQKANQYQKRFKQLLIPDNQKIYSCQQAFNNESRSSAIMLTSGSSVKEMFQQQLDRFIPMFRRKAFLNFCNTNSLEMELESAQQYLTNIIAEYSQIEKYQFTNIENKEQDNEQKEKTFLQVANEFNSIEFDC